MTQEIKDLIAEASRRVGEFRSTNWQSRGGGNKYIMAHDLAKITSRLADALEATLGEPTDVREHLHAKCDCVPDLGPAHCHLCGSAKGSPVSWLECEAVAVPDAATAAIERVRALLDSPSDERGITWWNWIEGGLGGSLHDDLRATLDGAPEPEWEWGYAGETLVGVHNSISRESAEEDVANLRRYWKDERKFWVVRRTPASEWLPVEGESNDA